MLYIFDQLEYYDNEKTEKMISILPPKRRKKAASYRFLKDKRLCCMAYYLFIYGMINEGLLAKGDSALIDFDYNDNGKPSICGKNIEFNISHCDEAVACVIADNPIGVDVQNFDTGIDMDTMRMIFSENEISDIQSSKDNNYSISRYWVIKESYLKCIGTGINDNMSQLDFSSFSSDSFNKDGYSYIIKRMKNYYLSVCERRMSIEDAEICIISPQQIDELTVALSLCSNREKGI